jgi:hypothetical protein
MKSFIFGEGQAAKTPQELARMRAVAEALMRGTGSPRNVGEGLNALGSGLSAMITNMAADDAEQAGLQSATGAMTPIAAALSGPGAFPPAPGTPGGDPGGVPVAAAPQMDPASARVAQAHGAGPSMPGNMSAYADAIASIESAGSGDYAALGPLTKKGNRAYGRYQVMDFNVGPWTEAALGKRMSPQEFLSDPAAQDAVFNHRFGDYVSQYGPEGAASMWFTGRPHAPNAKDILGTSGAGYVGKFNRALQQRQARAPGPVQVASLDPSAGFPPRPPAPGSDVYGAVPAIDDRGEDQHAKFREWNPDPLGNEQANLQQIDPALQKVIARAKEIAGTDFVLGSGQRGEDMQKKALGWGWSGTMDSDHLGGGAADLWPLNDQQQVNFDRGQQDRITAAMKQAAQELGVDLEAGADWRNPDRPHFGMIGQTPLHNAPVPTPRPGGSAPNGQAAIAQALTPPAAAMPPAQAPAVNPQVAQALAPQGTQGRLPSQATPSLRPFRPGERRPNPDGSYSTEVSTTWQLPDGQWVNVPSLWMGRDGPIQFPANDEKNILGAMRDYESRSGAPVPRFASLQEAEAAARQRSADGGAGSAPPLPAPRTIPDAPMVASVPQQIQQQQPAPSVAQALMPPQQRPAPAGPMPEMAGNTTHIDTTRGPTMQQIMAAAANPWLNDSQRGLLNGLMQQQMAERDPLTAMQREKARLELEALRNPKPKMTDDISEYEYAKTQGYTGTLQDFMRDMKKAGATNVNVGGAERGYDKTVGEGYGKRFLDIQEQSQSATRALTALDVMEQAISDPGFYSGVGAGSVQTLKRLGASLGMDPEGISSMETFNAMSKQAALDAMGGSLGTGFSNADRDFVIDQVPNLGNTPQGNQQLVTIQRKLNQRKQQIASLAREYAGQNEGRIDAGFDDFLAKWAEANPLFPKVDKAPTDGMPKTGDVVDGYRYKGGDPADPNSWERAQ